MPQKRKPAIIQPKVRLPEDLHKKLWRAAEKAGRSLNAEIALRLTTSFALEAQLEEADKNRERTQALFDQAVKMFEQAQALQNELKDGLLGFGFGEKKGGK